MRLKNTTEIGNAGEKKAQRYLKRRFYKILDTQYKRYCGEIDIIASKKDTIIFVEVRTRSSNYLVSPADSITKKKQNRIMKTALFYITENHINQQIRFDVIEVIIDPISKRTVSINHIENAFTWGDNYAPF